MLHLMAFFLIFFSLCQLDTCKCVVLFFMYICKCSLMPFMFVLIVCKDTLLCGGNKEYLTSDIVFLLSIFETSVYNLHVCVLIYILLFHSVCITYKSISIK